MTAVISLATFNAVAAHTCGYAAGMYGLPLGAACSNYRSEFGPCDTRELMLAVYRGWSEGRDDMRTHASDMNSGLDQPGKL